MSSRLFQFCRYKTHAAFAFCQAETPLNFHALTFIYVRLLFVGNSILLRSAECRTGKPDMMLLAVRQIVPVAINLVCENPLGIMAFTLVKALCNLL